MVTGLQKVITWQGYIGRHVTFQSSLMVFYMIMDRRAGGVKKGLGKRREDGGTTRFGANRRNRMKGRE